MGEAVRYGDVDYYEDRWAPDALIATVLPEMQFSLSKKRTAKEAWDAIAAARIGSDRAHKITLQALRKEWNNLPRGLSPLAGSYISLRNSGRPTRVAGRRGSPLPQRVATSAASRTRQPEAGMR
jgi:hypothetical protein